MNILLVGERERFAPETSFAAALAKEAVVTYQPDGGKALQAVQQSIDEKRAFDVVCVGNRLEGDEFTDGLGFARTFAARFPLINCAVTSASPPDVFHEETEGLGIVMQLPPEPQADDAARLFAVLRKISGLLR